LEVLTAEGRLANGLPLCCFSTCAEVMGKAALFAYCGLFVVMWGRLKKGNGFSDGLLPPFN